MLGYTVVNIETELKAVVQYLKEQQISEDGLNTPQKCLIKAKSDKFFLKGNILCVKEFHKISQPVLHVYTQAETSHELNVYWSCSNKFIQKATDIVQVIFKECSGNKSEDPVILSQPFDSGCCKVSYLEGGRDYNISVSCLKVINVEQSNCSNIFIHSLAEKTLKHRTVLLRNELVDLFNRARNLASNDAGIAIDVLYRNKPGNYWNEILYQHYNVMKPYMKDYNGDPANPINGKLCGLFFAGRKDRKTGYLPMQSPFGNTRIVIPIRNIFDPNMRNLYFTDFYCLNSIHYVTIVITVPGSPSDMFCRSNDLLLLNNFDNPFCMFDIQSGCFLMAMKVHVELFYTEPVDLKYVPHCFRITEIAGRGTSTLKGLPKNPSCNICNLYTTKRKRHDSVGDNLAHKKQKNSEGACSTDINDNNIIEVKRSEESIPVVNVEEVAASGRRTLKAKRPTMAKGSKQLPITSPFKSTDSVDKKQGTTSSECEKSLGALSKSVKVRIDSSCKPGGTKIGKRETLMLCKSSVKKPLQVIEEEEQSDDGPVEKSSDVLSSEKSVTTGRCKEASGGEKATDYDTSISDLEESILEKSIRDLNISGIEEFDCAKSVQKHSEEAYEEDCYIIRTPLSEKNSSQRENSGKLKKRFAQQVDDDCYIVITPDKENQNFPAIFGGKKNSFAKKLSDRLPKAPCTGGRKSREDEF